MRMPEFWSRVAGLRDTGWQARLDFQGKVSLCLPTLGTLSIEEVCRSFNLPSRDSRRITEAGDGIGQRYNKTRRKLWRALGLRKQV